MENAVRLASYKVGLEHGMTKQRAASMAKNLTVNFNRKGQIATQTGALYAFFNASMQGTARLYETLKGPKGKQIIAGGITLGVMQALALAAAGFDDDEPPDFVRERSLIIPISDKKYLSIPMPLGLHVLPNIGRIATEMVLGGFKNPAKHLARFINMMAQGFNPLGGGGDIGETATPTMFDPAVALYRNKDWTGKPIYKDDFSKNEPTPGHTRKKDTATKHAELISRGLNYLSGGTEFKPGGLSPTPDMIDYLVGQVTGGVGREISKTSQTVGSTLSGEELPPYKIPIVGRLYGDASSQSAQGSRFYENLRKFSEHEMEINGRAKAREDVAGYLKENPEARLWQMANATQREVGELQKRKRELKERGAEKARVKEIEEQITQHMTRFNDRVREVRGY